MKALLKALGGAALLVTAMIGAVQPVQAHDGAGTAIAAGILGVGLGAAIASDHPRYAPVQYYAPPPPPPPGWYRYGYAPPPPREVCRVRYDWYGYPHQRCWWAY